MQPANQRISVKNAWCLEKPGELFLIYLPAGSEGAQIDLPDDKRRTIQWFNPRTGSSLKDGDIKTLVGKGFQKIGNPPAEKDKDWVVIVR